MGGILFLQNVIPHRSLENHGDKIRWSFDLRWQKPGMDTGMFNNEEAIVFRTSANKNLKVDWGDLILDEKTQRDKEALLARLQVNETLTPEDQKRFSTIIAGPWMSRWKVSNHNKHTRAHEESQGTIAGWHK